jgi:hypothetical protein
MATKDFRVIVSMTVVDNEGNLIGQKARTVHARPTLNLPSDDANEAMKEEIDSIFDASLQSMRNSFQGLMRD